MAYQDEIMHMERGEIESLQLERLKKTLVTCYEKIEFYKKSFDEAGFDPYAVSSLADIESAPFEEFGMAAERKRFQADDELRSESFENVFVGGDCQTGPATVIRAIAAGKVAARNIDEFLGYHHKLACDAPAYEPHQNVRTPMGRVNILERRARERMCDWAAVETEMSLEEALQECSRCLRCDHFGCGAMDEGRVQYA